MSRRDVRLGQLLRVYIDGVPLDLASRLLPRRTRLSPSLYAHIHLHARFQSRFGDAGAEAAQARRRKISRLAFAGLADNLESTVSKLSWKAAGTEWADYYDETNYTAAAFAEKERLVAEFLAEAKPSTVWDLGANTGRFSRIAADKGALVVSFDIDPVAVERNYLDRKNEGSMGIIPLTLDLTNPSPPLGWHLGERDSLVARGPADAVLALALVHHLAISNNVPLAMIADFLADIGKWLVIEWVPKSDSQVKRLLATREDIFTDYTREAFERALERRFEILHGENLKESERTLYLARARA